MLSTRHIREPLLCLILAFGAAPIAMHAQAGAAETRTASTVPAQTPEQVAADYFGALKQEGLSSSTRFFHPEELQKFKDMLTPVFAAEAQTGGRELLSAMFGPEATLETVEAAKGEDFMTGIMKLLEAQLSGQAFDFKQLDVLGSVPEDEIMHVLARFSIGVGELTQTKVEVISMRPYEGSWRLLLTGQLDGLAKALQAEYQTAAEEAEAPPESNTDDDEN